MKSIIADPAPANMPLRWRLYFLASFFWSSICSSFVETVSLSNLISVSSDHMISEPVAITLSLIDNWSRNVFWIFCSRINCLVARSPASISCIACTKYRLGKHIRLSLVTVCEILGNVVTSKIIDIINFLSIIIF